MKQLLNIALLITLFSCKAQTIIVPIGSGDNIKDNQSYYEKDVNNEFGKFKGTWKYQNGNTQIIFKLKKETHYQKIQIQKIQNMQQIINILTKTQAI